MAISPEFVEKYQIEYAKNPNSRIFAPLAEAYRQMGMIDEAYRICSVGVKKHPDFAGGLVAFARILIAREDLEGAVKQLERATRLSPDNLLAHSLLGETLLDLRRPKDALRSFKMVLFLKPDDERALKAVRKWEFLSADDYDGELFEMEPIFKRESSAPIELKPLISKQPPSTLPQGPAWRFREIERAVSLADAFTVRGQPVRALEILTKAQRELGSHPELDRRLELLNRRSRHAMVQAESGSSATDDPRAARVLKLQVFLRRINDRRLEG